MIRIRHPDFLSGSGDLAGLHGNAECGARGVTVYLLPGLTGRQRKAVIRRLRQEASRGVGPALPLPGLVIALAVDRVRAGVLTAAAVVRLHPAAVLLPGAVAAGMALFVLSSTSAVPPTGLGRVPAGNGRLASAVRSVPRPVLDQTTVLDETTVIGRGGSGLGSAVPVWQARPHLRRHHRGCSKASYRRRGRSHRRQLACRRAAS